MNLLTTFMYDAVVDALELEAAPAAALALAISYAAKNMKNKKIVNYTYQLFTPSGWANVTYASYATALAHGYIKLTPKKGTGSVMYGAQPGDYKMFLSGTFKV